MLRVVVRLVCPVRLGVNCRVRGVLIWRWIILCVDLGFGTC